MARTTPPGACHSPISPDIVADADHHPNWPALIGDEVWWAERLASEGGRTTLVRHRLNGTAARSVLPAPWNVRSRVLEYGGRAWAGGQEGDQLVLVFVNAEDQRLYRYNPESEPRVPRPLTPLTRQAEMTGYVDPVIISVRRTDRRTAEVWCVRERQENSHGALRELVAVPLDCSAERNASAIRRLASSHDFITGPRVSPDGGRVSWIGWNHPRMPWDGAEACVADIRDGGTVGPHRVMAGGANDAVAQVEWGDANTLYLISDRSGWWNLYRVDLETGRTDQLCPSEQEFGGALTKIGLTWFAPLANERLAVIHGGAGRSFDLSVLDVVAGTLRPIGGDRTEWLPLVAAGGTKVVAVGASAFSNYRALLIDANNGSTTTLSQRADVDAAYLPVPELRTFVSGHGHAVHAVLYRPRGHRQAPAPYVVFVHSGPTGRFPAAYDLEVAYFTSRGIGVLAVNYSGSTGFGRSYRNRLRHNWGVLDVEECATAVESLVSEGLADRTRLGIRGKSAGAWTAAVSIARRDLYRCAVLYYPILDAVSWRAAQTDGFEAFYLDSLIGPWPAARPRYVERSPATGPANLSGPFLLLQGQDDPICPPRHAQRFLAAAKARGLPFQHLVFEGERHGFKRASTAVLCLEAELAMYREVFGLDPVTRT